MIASKRLDMYRKLASLLNSFTVHEYVVVHHLTYPVYIHLLYIFLFQICSPPELFTLSGSGLQASLQRCMQTVGQSQTRRAII